MLPFILLLATLAPCSTAVCDSNCQQRQKEALVGLYGALGGPSWPRKQGWTEAPEHCNWEGVQCCTQASAGDGLGCMLSGAVVGLDLSVNNLTGIWPAAPLEALADSLQSLSLRGNSIQGRLPAGVGKLQLLSVLYIDDNILSGALPGSLGQLQNLTQLTASANRFAGTIPTSLSRLDRLQWLLLNNNQLTGVVPGDLLMLPQLQLLSLQGNQLQGPLPTEAVAAQSAPGQGAALMGGSISDASPARLIQVKLSHNSIGGTIPSFIAQLPTLLLDLSYNKLTGSIPAVISSNTVLRELYLGNNRLTGTLSSGLLSASLQVLDLSSNQLSGTLPPLATSAYAVEVVNLSNNSFTGQIPADVDRLVSLQQVDLSSNKFTPRDGLPASLIVDSSQPGVAAGSADAAMLCRPVVAARNPAAQVELDPSSYGYEGCYCKEPWVPVVTRDAGSGAVSMTCTLQQQGKSVPLAHVLGPLLAVLGVALVALIFMGAAWRWGLAGFVQRFSDQAEKKAPPGSTAKEVTLVLTDVQGSTELWEWDQQLASEAFKLHDRVLRQYMTHFYGYEVSTEGDAFLVAFHEPFDAVAWCLCVQLALHYADWPTPLLVHKSTCLDTAETLERKRRQRQDRWQQQMIYDAQGQHANLSAADVDGTGGRDGGPWVGGVDALMQAPLVAADDDDEDNTGSSGALEHRAVGQLAPSNISKAIDRSVLFRGLRVRMSVATGGVDSVRLHSVTQRAEYIGEVLRKVQAVGETPQGGQIIMDSETFRGIHSRLPELGSVVLEATQKLLRSRVGPSAQELANMFSSPPGTEWLQRPTGWMRNSVDFNAGHYMPTIHSAEEAFPTNSSDANSAAAAGAGMPNVTEVAMKNGTTAGAYSVGAPQPDFKGDGARRKSAELKLFAPGNGDLEEGGTSGSPAHTKEQGGFLHQAAVLLGLQEEDDEDSSRRGTNDSMATFAADAPSAARSGPPLMGLGRLRKRDRQQGSASNGLQRDRRRSSLSYGVMVIDMGVHQLSGLPQKVNLVQVLPCGLEDRARFFPRLDSLRQETPGYFDAPAAGIVPLSTSGDMKGTAMPPVTIVFCTIDKYCDLVVANRPAAELALELYSDCVRWLLLVGGGYECQESEGTFMVAFSSADVAIEWCLMVQQVLKDMSWPASVLELPMCEEERDMHGNVMFSGPRVKMGVYSGTPTRVMPHTTTGRADYFGPLVNRAARYCHAAARGGQVLVPKELMFEVISQWVLIDPVELLQSDCLLEFAAFFDEDRRLWPWMFKRRGHWDMAMPAHLYPAIPPPPPVMGPLWQQAAAEAAATPVVWQQQQGGMQSLVGADGLGMVRFEGRPVGGEADKSDAPPSARTQPWEGGRISSSSLSQSSSVRKSHGNALAAAAAAAEEAELLATTDQILSGSEHTGMSDVMPLGRLAPLHESAEGGSSRASEADASHLALAEDARPAWVHTVPPHLRRYSDVTQQYSRLGPQHLQALQMQYNQSLAGHGSFTPPDLHPCGLLQQPLNRSAAGGMGPLFAPLPIGGLLQPGYLSARHRRPSYVSDVSSRYQRFSNASDLSGIYPSSVEPVTPRGTPTLAGGFMQREPSSRRPSALSDFFPVGSRSRRPSNTSQGERAGWTSMGNNTVSGTGSVGSQAGADASGAAVAGAMQPSAFQQHMQMEQQAQQLHRQLQQYQQQQQKEQQQVQSGAPWRLHMLKMQRAASGSGVPSAETLVGSGTASGLDQGRLLLHSSAPSQLPSAAAMAGGIKSDHHVSALEHVSAAAASTPFSAASRHLGTLGSPAQTPLKQLAQQQQRHLQQVDRRMQGSGAAAAAAAPTAGEHKSSGTGSVGHSGALQQSNSIAGSRDSIGARHVTQPAVPPAALLLQGLENQVLPGMLHSSNRLRLVSKRRRQMSYCFFQETSKPGNPADASDTKRLVGFGGSPGVSLAPRTGTGSSPHSNYAASDAAGSSIGVPPAGLATIGSATGSVMAAGKRSAGNSAGVSSRGSGRTSGAESGDSIPHVEQGSKDLQQQQQQQADAADGAAADTADAGLASSTLRSPAEEREHASTAAAAAAPADAASATAAQQPCWGAAVMDDYCGLPEIEPLPDVDVLESLRLAADRTHRPSTVSTLTDSVAGFEGPKIGSMCAEIMRGRWLWIGELLVHDLGQFRFKGVAGVHSIVSVTSEELGGRTFPTTIRRGKGEQTRLGRGLLAMVQMRARARQPGWGPYAGQQLLQNPAPSTDQHAQPYMAAGVGLCQACSGMGLQAVSSRPTTAATDSAAATGVETAGITPLQASTGAVSPATVGGQLQTQQRDFGSMPASTAASGPGSTPGRSGHMQMLATDEIQMLRAGSVGDLRALYGTQSPAMQPWPLVHLGSAPESSTAAVVAGTAAAGSNSSGAAGGYHYLNPAFHPSHMPSEQARQHWQKQLLQQHIWQQQQQMLQQQQRAQRRRHSVCVGSVHRRWWSKPYGVRAEMYPFEEADEWSFQVPHHVPPAPLQQLQGYRQANGITVGSIAAANTPEPAADSAGSEGGDSRASSRPHEPLASIDGCVPAAAPIGGAASYPDLCALPAAGMSDHGSVVDSGGLVVSCPALAQGPASADGKGHHSSTHC